MPMIDLLLNRIKEKGWLAISSLYFDNSFVCNVFNSRGYVAYSPSHESFFTLSCLDSTDTANVENKYVVMTREIIGMQQTITCISQDMLQHFDYAMYSQYSFYADEQEKFPWPEIPTREKIESMIKNEETGLYDDADLVHRMSGREDSAIGLYKKEEVPTGKYSGAVIDNWKTFYKNQDKFVQMLSECFGITDAI